MPASALASLDAGARLDPEGARIEHDAQNCWHLVGTSIVQLEGRSCTAVRSPRRPPELLLRWPCSP